MHRPKIPFGAKFHRKAKSTIKVGLFSGWEVRWLKGWLRGQLNNSKSYNYFLDDDIFNPVTDGISDKELEYAFKLFIAPLHSTDESLNRAFDSLLVTIRSDDKHGAHISLS
jgi:hypothetical protein